MRSSIQRRSALPGRERWKVVGLRQRPRVAASIASTLEEVAGVHRAEASAVSGQILVFFDPSAVKEDIGQLILSAIDTISLSKASARAALTRSPSNYRPSAAGSPSARRDSSWLSPGELGQNGGLGQSKVERRSALPGRERWEVPGLRRRPLLAASIATTLQGVAGIHRVETNATSGRILVFFNPNTVNGDIGQLILSAIDNAPAHSKEESDPREQSSLTRLIQSVKTRRKHDQRAPKLSALGNLFFFAGAFTMGHLVVTVISRGSPLLKTIGLRNPFIQVGVLGGLFLVGKGSELTVGHLRNQAWHAYASEVEHALRVRTLKHVESLDMSYLEDESTGRLMGLINDDSAKIYRYIEQVPNSVINKTMDLVVLGSILLVISPVLGILTLAPLPIIYYNFNRFREESTRRAAKAGERKDYTNRLLANTLSGLSTIKSFTSEDDELRRFILAGRAERLDKAKASNLSSYHSNTTHFVLSATLMVSLLYAAVLALRGVYPKSLLLVQVFWVGRMTAAMRDLSGDFSCYENALAAGERLTQILGIEPRILSGDIALPKHKVAGEIYFENVTFGYTGPATLLKDIDFRVPSQQRIAVVGSTGAGKSTLVKLLLRFYDLTEGRILLDGTDIRDLKTSDLRNAIGMVSQETYLFDGTVYENIVYGRPDADFEEVVAAARAAEAFDFISRLPEGFDTVVGERGQKLSGGERQRLAIARAVLKDPPILVLDEATSSVDNETEAAIQRSISRISTGRTSIVIAHRLSTVRHADRILFLSNGKIMEQGTHDELIELDGQYALLWKFQTGELDEADFDRGEDSRA